MSAVVVVKNKQVASIGEMHRLALKRIFDKQNMTYPEEVMLDHSIQEWPKKVDPTKEEKMHLKVIVQALIDNEDGKFNDMKEAMIQHNLDYKKVYDGGL